MVFYINLLIHYILLGFVIYSIIKPSKRIWPPPSKSSWQYRVYWSLYYFSIFLYLIIFYGEYDSWIVSDDFRYFVGIPLSVFGFLFMLWGVFTLSLKNTYGLKNGFVTKAPYTFTRNPQYVGDITLLIGLTLFCNSQHLTILFLLAIITFIIMPFSEEIWLEETYKEKYLQYKYKTNRFL